METLVTLAIVIIVIGLVLYLVQMMPMDATFKKIAIALLILVAIIFLLGMLFGGVPVVRLR